MKAYVCVCLQDSILKITGVEESDEATYQCMATNQLGTSYSSAQLKVLSKCQTGEGRPGKDQYSYKKEKEGRRNYKVERGRKKGD